MAQNWRRITEAGRSTDAGGKRKERGSSTPTRSSRSEVRSQPPSRADQVTMLALSITQPCRSCGFDAPG
eukprot:scaffold32124_cov77-Phaeocystis_antarctica.AAC.3